MATYWTAIEQPEQAYKIFLQIRNSHDEVVLTADHFPFPVPNGNYQPVPINGKYGEYLLVSAEIE